MPRISLKKYIEQTIYQMTEYTKRMEPHLSEDSKLIQHSQIEILKQVLQDHTLRPDGKHFVRS